MKKKTFQQQTTEQPISIGLQCPPKWNLNMES